MALEVGIGTILVPLTEDVFGGDGKRVIAGCIEVLTQGHKAFGIGLRADGKIYVHPTLFRGMGVDVPFFHAQVSLVGGVIELHGVDSRNHTVLRSDEACFQSGKAPAALPVKPLKPESLDAILVFVDQIRAQGFRCVDSMCRRDPGLRLEWRESVLVSTMVRAVVICSECFDRHCAVDRYYRFDQFTLDGRRIPQCASVMLWNPEESFIP